MDSDFSSRFFAANRKKLRDMCADQTALIVLTANGLMQRSGDTTFQFRQDSNFWYLTGINDPDVILVMDGNDEYLIAPHRDMVRTIFDGGIDTELISTVSGIPTVLSTDEGWQRLRASLNGETHIGICEPMPVYESQHGFYANPSRKFLQEKVLHIQPTLKCVDVRPYLAKLRMVKQKEEISAIQKAITISADTFMSVKDHLAEYAYEYEVEAALTRGFRAAKASGHAYAPIVAGGKNACTLHYVRNDSGLAANDLLLIDAGAEYLNYAADITRTFAISTPSARQRAVYEAVVALQQFAFSYLQPGVMIREYEHAVEQEAGKVLSQLNIISSHDSASIRHYYPHATSHFLGLDVHDVGDYEYPLEANMVMTVEPGIYIPEENIGIRIEDDIVITNTGNVILSADLPSTLS